MRILVVEDEADLNLLLCKVLTKAGYTVDGCLDGEDAQAHLLGAAYDGILLDVMLPKKDGYTLVQELRDQGNDTPVLFLTARDSVAALAREVCAEGPWPQDRLTLEGGEPVFAQVDRALIARLLQNLIDNGFKYGKPGGGVWVTLRRQGGEALLTVRDDGIGIAPDQQARVWQRFYQVDPVRGEKSGAGLGLSMVWKIAQAHGGHMSLESVPGQGSSFTLHLPAER